MLEEHIRELELRSEERLQTEQKRNKDSIQRLEREKQLEIENYSIKYEIIILLKTINKQKRIAYLSSNVLIALLYFNRNQSLERDLSRAQQEVVQLKSVVERLRLDKAEFEEQLNEVSKEIIGLV